MSAAVPSKKMSSHKPHVTVSSGMSGYFAVMLWWNPEMGGFWEPWDTGIGRYATQQEAEQEGREWAESEEVEFVPPKTLSAPQDAAEAFVEVFK